MARMTRKDLTALRERARSEREALETDGKTSRVFVGMGTCGIAAGASDALAALNEEVAARKLTDVIVKRTGCIGLCYSEPTVEVLVPGMPPIVYGNVNKEVARRIVNEHIMNRTLVSGYVYDKPAADVVQ